MNGQFPPKRHFFFRGEVQTAVHSFVCMPTHEHSTSLGEHVLREPAVVGESGFALDTVSESFLMDFASLSFEVTRRTDSRMRVEDVTQPE
jgi:hypothetical protein